MKRLFCLFVLSSFCFLNSTNFAYADNNTCSRLTVDQLPDGPGGKGEVRSGYERAIFQVTFKTGHSAGGGFGIGAGHYNYEDKYDYIVLSCCVKVAKWKVWNRNSTCDFSLDHSDCDRFINRETGKIYEIRTNLL